MYYIDSDSDSDILFNINMYIYITQQNNSLLDNQIVYTRICHEDWTKVS